MIWEPVKTDGNVYCDLWNKFWGKTLDFEPDVTVASVDDDDEKMVVEKLFKVLTIDAHLKVRQEYLGAVVPLNKPSHTMDDLCGSSFRLSNDCIFRTRCSCFSIWY